MADEKSKITFKTVLLIILINQLCAMCSMSLQRYELLLGQHATEPKFMEMEIPWLGDLQMW